MSTILTTEAVPGAETTGDALAAYVKTTVGTEYHPMSSCSMLPKDKGGVVDTRLVVYGTSNVRVADASIMPVHVSAHLMASTYGVAEKVSDLIKEEQEAKAKAAAAAAAKTSSISKTATSTSAPKSATSAPSSSGSSTASKSSAGDSSISTGAKIGIGIGAGVAAILIAAALVSRAQSVLS
jgi:nitrate reductase alpha subunit